jgi:DNA-binding protein HU-beta
MIKPIRFSTLFKTVALVLVVLGLTPASLVHAMNKGELIDAMAKEARISSKDAALIYDSLTEELTAAAKEGSVDFRPFGIISKEDGREVFYGHVTVLKGAEHDPDSFVSEVSITRSSRSDFTVDSFFDIAMRVVPDADVPSGEVFQDITLIEADPRSNPPQKKSKAKNAKDAKDYVVHAIVRPVTHEGDDADLDGVRKEYIGHVSLLRGAGGGGGGTTGRDRGWNGTYKGKLSMLRSTSGGYDFSGHAPLLKAIFADAFFDIYFRQLIDLTLTKFKVDVQSCDTRSSCKGGLFGDAGFDLTSEFLQEAELALAYKKRIDKASPALMRALDCNGKDDDCNGPWHEVETTLRAAAKDFEDVAFLLADGTPVFATVSLGKADQAVWNAGVEGFIARGKSLTRDGVPPVGQTTWSTVVDRVAANTGFDTEMVALSLRAMGDAGATALAKGDRVSLVGFGSFSISKRAARTGRNPQTGKEIKIAAKKVAKFKAGKALADTVK